MTSDENINTEEVTPLESVAEVTPGQLLNRKREALGLTVQQVADELHITMHYVRALEADAHDKLPGDVFIRGYIRAYANYLKLDPTVLVNVFNEFISQKESIAQEATHTRNRRRRDRNLPWIAVSGVAFVVIAVALWYFGAGTGGQANTAPAPAGTNATTSAPTVQSTGSAPITLSNVASTRATGVDASSASAAGTQAPVVTTVVPLTPAASPVTTSTAAPAADLPAMPTATPSVAPTTIPSAAPATPPAAASTPATPEPATPTAVVSAPVIPAQIISVDAGGSDVVEIVFSGESLVQIDDGSAKQIYRDILVAGDRLQVNGKAPFNVLLGDASTAELHLNGKKIDFSENIRIDNSARLTIGL